MNNIINLDQYIQDFESVVLPEFKSKAEELLYVAVETCDPGENLEVSAESDMCKDRIEHIFLFYEQPDMENIEETGGLVICYGGFY